MKNGQSYETYSTMDAYLSAFLIIKKFKPSYRFSNGRVIFVFELTPRLQRELDHFESGEMVNVSEFTKTVKSIKSKVFEMKDEKRYGQRQSSI